MQLKHLLLILALALLLYLGVYSWNQRTHHLDAVATNTGLEASGAVLKFVHAVQDSVVGAWDHYLYLVNVREENDTLRRQLADARLRLSLAEEERAELLRLRRLLTFVPPEGWECLGARVVAGRMGPNAAMVTLLIGRGYLTGAVPGTPVMTPEGIVGRVLRAGPSTATVLLMEDPGSKISVVSVKNRVQGVLAGNGVGKPLELQFVAHNAAIDVDELLVTSGLDGVFPRGIPVARVLSALPSDLSPFQSIHAAPLAGMDNLEELLLISRMNADEVWKDAESSGENGVSETTEKGKSGKKASDGAAKKAALSMHSQSAGAAQSAGQKPQKSDPASTRRNRQ